LVHLGLMVRLESMLKGLLLSYRARENQQHQSQPQLHLLGKCRGTWFCFLGFIMFLLLIDVFSSFMLLLLIDVFFFIRPMSQGTKESKEVKYWNKAVAF